MIVLDTNVVSEFMRPSPDAAVLAWLDGIPRGEVWTTSVTVAEIAAGIAGLPEGKQRTRLQSGFITALRGFDDRILAFTAFTALKYGEIIGHRNRLGRPISIADAQIASIAEHAQATLATRNTRDFDGIDITVVNPWDADAARP